MLQHDTWAYKGQFQKLFRVGETIPDGWTDKPEVPYAAEGEWPEVVKEFHTPKAPKVQGDEVRRGPGRPPKVAGEQEPKALESE